jgi:hypothetical protein
LQAGERVGQEHRPCLRVFRFITAQERPEAASRDDEVSAALSVLLYSFFRDTVLAAPAMIDSSLPIEPTSPGRSPSIFFSSDASG